MRNKMRCKTNSNIFGRVSTSKAIRTYLGLVMPRNEASQGRLCCMTVADPVHRTLSERFFATLNDNHQIILIVWEIENNYFLFIMNTAGIGLSPSLSDGLIVSFSFTSIQLLPP